MATSPSMPAVLPCMQDILSQSAQTKIREIYSELQASVKLSDEDRDDAQRHLLERMLFEAGEDRTGHVGLGFASHPVLQMGFTNALRDAVSSNLAAIVNWRVLARLLPLAHKAPEDAITWRAIGECWVRSCPGGEPRRTCYSSFCRVYFSRMGGKKLPNDSTCFENIIHLWHGMIQEHLCPSYDEQSMTAAELMKMFEALVNTVLMLLAGYGVFSLSKVVLRALSTYTLEGSAGGPMWNKMQAGLEHKPIMAAYLSSKFDYAPFNSDKSGKQFQRMWKLIGGSWDTATQIYPGDTIFRRLNFTIAHSPGRVLGLLQCVLRERGQAALTDFLTEKAAMLSEERSKALPRYFIFLTRCLFSFARLTRRWFSVGVRELLAAGQKQNRAHPVPARTVMESVTADMCRLIDFLARVVPNFRACLVDADGIQRRWQQHVALFELRSWQHGFVSNIMAAFSLCQDVIEDCMFSASRELVQGGDFRHDSSDEDEYGVPKMTRGHTLRPQDAAWLLDLISDNKLSAPSSRRSREELEFTREAPYPVVMEMRAVGRAPPKQKRANFAMKPLVCFGAQILQHLHRHHSIEMPVELRQVCNAGPPTPSDYSVATAESAVGRNSNGAWQGGLSWITRRGMVLHRVCARCGDGELAAAAVLPGVGGQ